MRLINADDFFNDFPELRDYPYEYSSKEYEVDAIPVEWIRQWHGINDIKDYDLREYVKCTVLYMLKDWKKENETVE